MFNFITAIFQQPEILMLIMIFILLFIGVVLQRIFFIWKQMPLQEHTDSDEAFWKEL
jgi:hypothetical protein